MTNKIAASLKPEIINSAAPGILTAQDIDFFHAYGYVVFNCRTIDTKRINKAVKLAWQELPSHFRSNDPSTWTGRVRDSRGYMTIDERCGRVKLRGVLRRHHLLLNLLPRNVDIYSAAEQLLGRGRIRDPQTVRGIYITFQVMSRKLRPVHGHLDAHPFSLGVVCYLDDVLPDGGGFTVWPESHRVVDPQLGNAPAYTDDTIRYRHERVLNHLPSLEITGRAGTVVFYHPYLLHAPGRNYRRQVRQALLCDSRDIAL